MHYDGWYPPPSPYEIHDDRLPQDIPNRQPNTAHHEQSGGPNPSYSCVGSISAHWSPNLSDSQLQHPQGGPGYENPPNGTQAPGLHLVTIRDVMSGNPQSLSPSNYDYPPQADPHASPVYPLDHSYGQHQMGSYTRRKLVRAAQACDSCRRRKAKCDEGRPKCGHCKDNNLTCFYKDLPPVKQDQQTQGITKKLDAISDNITLMRQIQEGQARQLDLISANMPPVRNQFHEKQNDPYKTDEFALPVKHTTAAQNLLLWPSVKALVPRGFTESYVMDLELKRGILCLYGRGEGEGMNGHSIREDEQAGGSALGGVWGNGQLPTRSPGSDPMGRHHVGGVSPSGGLVLTEDLVTAYANSYLANVHILHPFLEIESLRDMVTEFQKKYSPDLSTGKRKRAYYSSSGGIARIEHSIANAIILLVLALGNICKYRTPLPGPVSDSSLPTPSSSPPIKSEPGQSDDRRMNMDVIPGLAYYATAASMLGEFPGGLDVSYIQANLLAGLYMGQLARVVASHAYISNACRACQVLIESPEYNSPTITFIRKNLIRFAFWTCLQLESDILAEVLLPPSGITRHEARMLCEMPDDITGEPDASRILRFYYTQIQLRRTLNDVHSNLYKVTDKELCMDLKVIENLDLNLEAWRLGLKDWDWDDRNHQSRDINVARMRAKYYGAKYIIHRPALRYLLELRTQSEADSSSTLGSRPSESPASDKSQQLSPAVSQSQASTFGQKTQKAAEECVMAAVRSTTVFDSVPERIIVTNIFGTAHA
jgi:hypothetical protein